MPTLSVYFNIVQILISIILVLAILVQTKGSSIGGLLGGGDSSSVFRTRRGIQKTLFRLTIGLAVIFIAMSLISVRVATV